MRSGLRASPAHSYNKPPTSDTKSYTAIKPALSAVRDTSDHLTFHIKAFSLRCPEARQSQYVSIFHVKVNKCTVCIVSLCAILKSLAFPPREGPSTVSWVAVIAWTVVIKP